jgi:hypothetical protein
MEKEYMEKEVLTGAYLNLMELNPMAFIPSKSTSNIVD